MADDVPTSSGPSESAPTALAPLCAAGAAVQVGFLSPQENARFDAAFLKLCTSSGGLVANEMRTLPSLTAPTGLRGDPLDNFYPPEEVGHEAMGIYVAYLVDFDGHVLSSAVLRSSGNPRFDKAAIQYIDSFHYKSPGRFESRPVRIFSIMRVDFRSR